MNKINLIVISFGLLSIMFMLACFIKDQNIQEKCLQSYVLVDEKGKKDLCLVEECQEP